MMRNYLKRGLENVGQVPGMTTRGQRRNQARRKKRSNAPAKGQDQKPRSVQSLKARSTRRKLNPRKDMIPFLRMGSFFNFTVIN